MKERTRKWGGTKEVVTTLGRFLEFSLDDVAIKYKT